MALRTAPIQPERIQPLNRQPLRDGKYVLYWMQQSQRADFNHALEYAIDRANELNKPLLVIFGLMDGYPDANLRHYRFMLEGLQETQAALVRRGIPMVVQRGEPDDVAIDFAKDACLLVCDRGYLRHQKQWRKHVASTVKCPVIQVESDVVVPVETASSKAEYAARTIRPKIHKCVEQFLVPLRARPLSRDSLHLRIRGLDLSDLDALLSELNLDRTVLPVPLFKGGASEARRILQRFIRNCLPLYVENRNQPQIDDVSHMSKYLHFGQISPVFLALKIRDAANAGRPEIESFLEELVVRRELACNFVHYTSNYDEYACLPAWARKTLSAHRRDRRPHLRSRGELENAMTADPYWNAAMNEMRHTGYMHNYMRMYWGKKILEWSRSPEEAYETTLCLNNKYFIDGRDPNTCAGVGWIFGLHDRPWPQRDIFGTVRYMSADGLRRKCDMEAYVQKVERLSARLR